MKEQPELDLSLTENGDVRMSRGSFIGESLWDQIVLWWADGKETDATSGHLVVPIGDFVVRMGWLRTDWTNQDRKVTLSADLRMQLGGVREAQERFEALLSGSIHIPNLELSGLQLKRVLTEQQLANINHLVAMDNGANFSVPGAGKTSTQLVVWKYLQVQDKVGKLLVICPRSALSLIHI